MPVAVTCCEAWRTVVRISIRWGVTFWPASRRVTAVSVSQLMSLCLAETGTSRRLVAHASDCSCIVRQRLPRVKREVASRRVLPASERRNQNYLVAVFEGVLRRRVFVADDDDAGQVARDAELAGEIADERAIRHLVFERLAAVRGVLLEVGL